MVALDDNQIVGCATIQICDESLECRAPFLASGFDVSKIVYFGESVLERHFRGRGIGHQFFAEFDSQ